MINNSFLFILDPLPSLNVQGDTSLALIQESCARGINCFACGLEDIFVKDGKLYFKAGRVFLDKNYKEPPHCEKKITQKALDFDLIFMRKDPPVDEKFIATLLLLSCHDNKAAMINQPEGLLLANEKLFGQKIVPKFFAPTLVASSQNVLFDFINEHEKVVLKPLFQCGGGGILVLAKTDGNLCSALEMLTASYTKPIMVQTYIENARLGDKRVIVLGGKPIGAVIRLPLEQEHRSNCHAGGRVIAASINDRDREIVDALKPHLLDLGLHLVGIDIIDGYLTEINVTSPTLVIEIENLSQSPNEKPLRAQIIDYLIKLIKNRDFMP
jgi:glutathione synthase